MEVDGGISPTFGKQEGSAYNGHFGYTCYHPLFVFNQFGNMEHALLRNGNVYSSDDWKSVLKPIIERYRDKDNTRYFRGDAAFANPDIYRLLEMKITSMRYALRMVVIGRRNYLFAGSEAGAERAAILYSLVASCKVNDHDPFVYFRDVLRKVSTYPADQIDDLLPSNWRRPDSHGENDDLDKAEIIRVA